MGYIPSRRWARALLSIALIAVFALLAGAGEVAAQTPIPVPSPNPPVPAPLVITQANNGQTLHAVIGQEVIVKLGNTLQWNVTVAPPGILQREIGVSTLPVGVQGVYLAIADGTATVTGLGHPICPTAAPCPQFVVFFQAKVVVTGTAPPPLIITQAENGDTFHVLIGQEVILELNPNLIWNVTVTPSGILLPLPAPATPINSGVQGRWVAIRGGTATINALGHPPCPPNEPTCPTYVIPFSATVIVILPPVTPVSSS